MKQRHWFTNIKTANIQVSECVNEKKVTCKWEAHFAMAKIQNPKIITFP